MEILNGPLLRKLRQERGLRFIHLSEACDVDRRTLAAYERQPPERADMQVVLKLARFYGQPVESLFVKVPHPSALASA